jgi:HSP20 family protein
MRTTIAPYWNSNWSPTAFASELFEEVDRMFGDIGRTNAAYDERSFDPVCEISENDQHYLMSVDLPGMKKSDIKIEMNDKVLTVSGERKREVTGKSYGFFKRSFHLPTTVDAEKIEARYEDGVLELYLPKVEAAKPRQIEIQAGKGGFFNKLLSPKDNEASKSS